MGYLQVIESNTTWVCPKTATYKIICVASGANGNNVGNPTSFGSYCTAYGCWGENTGATNYASNLTGYTLFGYAQEGTGANASALNIGYGAGLGASNTGTLGKLKVAIRDIKKDTSVICTIGEGVISSNGASSNSGVIVVQEIGIVSDEDIDGTTEEPKEFTINLYRYSELYTTLKIKEGTPLVFPSLPVYNTSEYNDDIEHKGFTTSYGGNKVYNVNQSIYPVMDMDYYAGYSYHYIDTERANTSDTTLSITITTNGTVKFYGYRVVISGGGTDHVTGNTTPSTAYCTFTINGSSVGAGSYTVKKGDVVTITGKTISIGSGSSDTANAYVDYPVVKIGNWRSEL